MDSSVTESQYRPIGLSHGSDVSLFSTVSQAIQSTSVLTGSDIITSSLMSSMTPAVYGSGAYHTGSSSPFGSATASGVSGSSLPLDSSRTATPTLQSYSPNVISSQTSVLPDVRTGQSTMSLFSVADGSIQDRSLSFTAYQGQSLQGSTVFPTSLTGFIPPATPLSMATTATVVPFMPLATSLVYQQSTAIPTLSTTSSVLATSTPTSSPLPPDQRLIRGELFITGPISHEDNTRLIDLIISSFNAPEQPGSSCCFIIVVDQSDKYFDNNWNSLIRIEYTFALLTGGIDPADTRNVMLTQLDRFLTTTSTFSINNNRVYRGYPHGPDVIFSLDVTGDVATATYPRMSVIIAESWATQNSGCGGCTFTSRIILGQRSAGRYGTRLTRLYYVVFKNGNLQLILSPEAPSINAIATSFSAHQDVYGLYMFDDVRSFSYHYEVLANSVVTLTSQRGRDAQYALRTQWQRYFNNSLCARTSCSIMLNYVRPELQYTDTNLAISNLAYFVTLNGNMVAPSSVVGPSQAEFGGIFTPCGCQHRGAHSLYVYGDVTYFTLRSLLNEVIQVNDGANIIARDFYYDIHRSLLTKVYFRTSSLDAVVPPQSSSSFQQVLGRYNLQTLEVGMPIRQKHRLVLEGVVGNQSIAQMMTALREAWASNSNEINVDDINVAIFKMDSESFVKQNGSRVTVVSYLVSVGQADGSLTIAEEPPVSSLALNFRQRFGDALAVCSCDVIKQHAITATGNLNPADGNQVDSVRKAIEEAWRDANKEYDGDIKVNIFSVTPGRVNASEPQSRDEERTVSFGVVLQNGTSGVTDLDLQPPRSTVLQTKFTDTGSEVAFVEEGVSNSGESDEFPWYIPVGVILALLLILVIIFVFICIFRDRIKCCGRSKKRKDSKEIDNNPDDFRDDNYDKEHFTMEPVAFENEAFHNLEMASQTYVVNPDETDDAGPF
ncbi:unnamed protein product [Lymnaea stagnalis]|uniref:Uncharacterized protein n=1 Tax=Lymnaea stagnalis TaxID=6523 RepID=A0AAV2IGL0_LYMST